MNERIKELAKVAEYWANTFEDKSRYQEYLMETFAGLIEAETITVLQKRFTGDLNREDMEVRRCIADVQKHFGVEK